MASLWIRGLSSEPSSSRVVVANFETLLEVFFLNRHHDTHEIPVTKYVKGRQQMLATTEQCSKPLVTFHETDWLRFRDPYFMAYEIIPIFGNGWVVFSYPRYGWMSCWKSGSKVSTLGYNLYIPHL